MLFGTLFFRLTIFAEAQKDGERIHDQGNYEAYQKIGDGQP